MIKDYWIGLIQTIYSLDMKGKFKAWILILTGTLMFSYWILFALFLPMSEEYNKWILDPDWTWVNVIGYSASLFGVFSLIVFKDLLHAYDKIVAISFPISLVGAIGLSSILFFEGFILKGITLENDSIIRLNESFYLHGPFKVANLLSGILFSTGVLVLAIKMIDQKSFRKWSLIVLLISCPLFSIVLFPGNIRLVGVLLYTTAFVSLGVQQLGK